MKRSPKLIYSLKLQFIFKSLGLWLFFLSAALMASAQTTSEADKVLITSLDQKTQVHTNENGQLEVNVPPKDVAKFKTRGWVQYSDFGAPFCLDVLFGNKSLKLLECLRQDDLEHRINRGLRPHAFEKGKK